MTENIIEYQYKCITEDAWINELRYESQGPPIECIHGAGHTVDWVSLNILSKIDRKKTSVEIDYTDIIDPDKVMNLEREWDLTVKADDEVSEITESFEYPVDMVSGYLRNKNYSEGDYFEVFRCACQEVQTGTVASDATAGDTDIMLSSDAYAKTKIGHKIMLGTDTTRYRVIGKTDVSETVTVESETGEGICSDKLTGDAVTFFDELPVGALAASASAGSQKVKMDSISFAQAKIGYKVKLGSDTRMYRIVAKDDATSEVSLQPSLYAEKGIGDTVKVFRVFAEHFIVDSTERIPIAREIKRGSGLVVGSMLIFRYFHASPPTDGKIRLWMAYQNSIE
jgi:hypothetical protein